MNVSLDDKTAEGTTHSVSYLETFYEIDYLIDDWYNYSEEEWESVDSAIYDNTYDALYWFSVD